MIKTTQILAIILLFVGNTYAQNIESPPPPPLPRHPSDFAELDLLARIVLYDDDLFDYYKFTAIKTKNNLDTLSFYILNKELELKKNIKSLNNLDSVVSDNYKLFYTSSIFSTRKNLVKGYFYGEDNRLNLSVKFGADSIAAEKEYYRYNKKGLLKGGMRFEYWSQSPDSVLLSEITYHYMKGVKYKSKVLIYHQFCNDCKKPWKKIWTTFNEDGNFIKNISKSYDDEGKMIFHITEENNFNQDNRLSRYIRSVNDVSEKSLIIKDFRIFYYDDRIRVKFTVNDEDENEFEYLDRRY